MFREKLCSIIILFRYHTVPSSFSCDKINISMFSHISHSFSKNCVIHQLKKTFLLSSVFISIYGFRQAFWLNLITLWTFFQTYLWFNVCFKFLMRITYSVLSCKLATNLLTNFILSCKTDKSLWSSWNVSRYWILASRKYPLSLFSL